MPTPLRCDPKLFEKDLSEQVYIVTGANSGCGLETSRQLCKQGATVVLACRNAERGEEAVKDIGSGAVFVTTLDLSSLESVRAFVKAFQEKYTRLDGLVNNAGVMACPYAKTKDGFEWQFGCNHLAHFLLMHLLTPLLLETAEKTSKPSRFVALSSVAAGLSTLRDVPANVDFDDLMWETREYDEGLAYGQSKLSNYLHATEAGKKYPADKLISTSVHPGWVLSPLDVHVFKKMFGEGFFANLAGNLARKFFLLKGDMITPVDGAQSTLHCLLEDADKMESGKFYSQFGIYKDPESKPGGWPMELKNPNVTEDMPGKLWEASEKLVGA
ncbi:daunorubicin C-13 ketoreductase DnrU [Seminavis robusta]|uniref:Daunorubicin C-13 ketoreductase DnrU n=1 Tax=Seminavis robusta TaxID=568900 RepID=A0A9N8DW54_9STRA|nr:daunorubicin C-13 ketoreductase DnrU [Seminavis robusta]|eukprot:Sro389_g132520.1 daunorubicin C-13 ketoreductase DnrU (328) ;mRNA; r:7489-8472